MTFELKGATREDRRKITARVLPIALQFVEPYTPRWQLFNGIDSDECNLEVNDGDTKAINELAELLEEMQITYRMV